MKPSKIIQFETAVIHDGVRQVLLILVLDRNGDLWQREAPDGAWKKIHRY